MADLICRRFVMLVIGAVLLGTLFTATPASAQSEGLELELSPNGKRALRLHDEKRAELLADYHTSHKQPLKRYEQACERHLDRYAKILDREMKTLTRKGSLDAAEAIQSAIQRAEGWAITPPNSEGFHFLTKENLEVAGSDKATKFGVDLQVNIEKAAELYSKQSQVIFDQYATKVAAVRKALQNELTEIKEQEQRAGRADAVAEVQAAIASIAKLPQAKRPQMALAQTSDKNASAKRVAKPIKLPAGADGCYVVTFFDEKGKLSHSSLVRLKAEGPYSLARHYPYNEEDAKWDTASLPISLVKTRGEWMAFYHDTPDGKGVVYEQQMGEPSQKNLPYWPGKEGFPVHSASLNCNIHKAEMKYYAGVGLKDGDYVLTMLMRSDINGQPTHKEVRFKAEVFAKSLLITHRSDADDPDKWQDCKPVLFHGHGSGDIQTLHTYKLFASQEDKLILDRSDPQNVRVRYWWQEDWHTEGRDASMVGKIERVGKQ